MSMNISVNACKYVPPTLFTEVPGWRLHQQRQHLRVLSTSVYNTKSKVKVALLLTDFPEYSNAADSLLAFLTNTFERSDFAENLYQAAAKTGAATVLASTYTGGEFSEVLVLPAPSQDGVDDHPAKGASPATGVIIGIAVGGGVLLLIVLGSIWYYYSKREQVVVAPYDDKHIRAYGNNDVEND